MGKFLSGKNVPKGSRNCEWMVTPLAFSAAMPVGARMTCLLWVDAERCRRKVVFPVPALPVRNTCRLVLLTKRAASAAISVVSICSMKYEVGKCLELTYQRYRSKLLEIAAIVKTRLQLVGISALRCCFSFVGAIPTRC